MGQCDIVLINQMLDTSGLTRVDILSL